MPIQDYVDLIKGFDYDIDNPGVSGLHDQLVIIAHDNITFTSGGSRSTTLTGYTLANNRKGYLFEGFAGNIKPSLTSKRTPAGVFFMHNLPFMVHDYSQDAKDNLERMAKGLWIGMVRHRKQDTNAFEVFGVGSGMIMVDGGLTKEYQSAETNGGFAIQLGTNPDGVAESKMPQTYLKTDYATSLGDFEDIYHAPKVTNITPITGNTAGGDNIDVSGENFFDIAGTTEDVDSVDFINVSTSAVTNQAAYTVDSDTNISITSSVALAAASYYIRITTASGIATSDGIIVIT